MNRRAAALLAVLAVLVGTCSVLGTAGPAGAAGSASQNRSFSATKTLTRSKVSGTATKVTDSRDVTVKVDKTTQLRGRERVHVTWSGAHPSGGRASNPFGENGLAQEYPVVIMQCRGLDDPKLPAAQQLSPSTCWTSTRQQRTQSASSSAAVWRHDLYATDAERAQNSGLDPFPDNDTCPTADFLSMHITPFVAANGTVYKSCSADTMPPEAAVGAAYPPSELAAYTSVDGTGSADFEIRTSVENESLGCNDKVRCSLVVIPIMGISCMDNDSLCNKAGRFAPGSSNFANDGVDDSVSPLYWWSPSNWRNRFSVPLSFGLPPGACDVLDHRAPEPFYGSELLSQAALQWSPAYCLRKDRFKFQHNRMSDEAAFSLMENGDAPAAFVSGKGSIEGTDPVAYAPTAVTGLAISYVIDKPDNEGEYTRLRLDPRLLAKLLTMSYPASSLGQQHPGLADNPLSMNLDPEFEKLNPRLDTTPREAAATLLSLSQSSDVVKTLTSYIAQDKDAMAFINGKADPWGMKVNPSYKGMQLPVSEWPLLDTFVPTSEQECLKQNPAVYLNQVAAPVSFLRTIAEAVLDNWPNVQTHCDKPQADQPFKLGRIDRQGIGSRFMLGVTSLGDSARFGLRTASLETAKGTFVSPSDASMAAAVRHASAGGAAEPFRLGQDAIAGDGKAYPGTMVVYTTARTRNLPAADASKVSQFIRVATTEGQRPGPGNGQLPEGFLPIRSTGPTAPLFRSARAVAADIAAQNGSGQGGGPGGSSGAGAGGGHGTGSVGSLDGGGAAGTTGPASRAAADSSAVKAATTVPTKTVPAVAKASATTATTSPTPSGISRLAGTLLPVVLFVGLLSGLGSVIVRRVNRAGRPGGTA